jgi:hypothetical protein|eukprot:COSAG06_NODE_183_length_20826_cov_4.724753_6_plen_130_part_00
MWMTPWGYTIDLPPDYDAHMELGLEACAAMDAVHGRNYCARTGPIFTVISPATGCCTDFMYGEAEIMQSLATELRSSANSDPTQIIENGEEMLAGAIVMAENLAAAHYAKFPTPPAAAAALSKLVLAQK